MVDQQKKEKFFKISEDQLAVLVDFFHISDIPSTKELPRTNALVAKIVRVFDQIHTQPIKLTKTPDLEDDAVFPVEE